MNSSRGKLTGAIRNVLFKGSMRLLMPRLARQMEKDGTFDLDPAKMPESIRILDNGADTTVFVFSGIDVLFAGFARYDFGLILRHLRKKCNFVFLRDIHRMAYHMSPEGEWNGLDFYSGKIEEAKAQLGAKRNVALGSSSGGSAAFYFGTRCKMDKLIVFGPAFPHTVYTAWASRLRTFSNFRLLLTDPGTYFEMVAVTLGASDIVRKLSQHFKKEEAWDILEDYRRAEPRPSVTLFYGKRCRPDSQTARALGVFPEVSLVPLDTGRHNTPEYLNNRKELGPRIVREVEAF
jgi:hypothetical protein